MRLHRYDYSTAGAYFVTICVQEREYVFGNIVGEEIELSQIGDIVKRSWLEIPNHFSNVCLDEFQIMPNHVHTIVVIWDQTCRDLINQIPTGIDERHFGQQTNFPLMKNPKRTLGKIIRHFKAKATKKIHDRGFRDFCWQGRYHDHIIRDQNDLERIREYIRKNPRNWALDEENPEIKIMTANQSCRDMINHVPTGLAHLKHVDRWE